MDKAAYIEMDQLEATNWWFVARRLILRKILDGMELRQNSKILEIGSGTGGNLEMLSQYGEVTAVEMEKLPFELSLKKASPNVKIQKGFLPDNLNVKHSEFDVVCLLDVLEHIDQDEESLNAVKSLLSSQGKLLITVPAYSWLWSSHDVFNHHKRRYTKKQLISDLECAGFNVFNCSYFNTYLFPVAVGVRLWERLFSRKETNVGVDNKSKFTNAVLLSIFATERHLFPKKVMPFGLSIWAVAGISN